MKHTFRIFSLILILALALVVLPGLSTGADAAAASSIKINGYTLTSGSYLSTSTWTVSTVQPSGGYVRFSGGTIYLSGATITTSGSTIGIDIPGDATLSLSGTNKINAGGYGIKCTGNLTVTGSGSLTINTDTSNAVYVKGKLDLQNRGRLTATATNTSAIVVDGEVVVAAKVVAQSDIGNAMRSGGKFTINGGTLNLTATHSTYAALQIGANLEVNGGSTAITSKYYGIRLTGSGNYLHYNGTMSVTSSGDTAIKLDGSSAYIRQDCGKLTVSGKYYGIIANQFISNGGVTSVKSTDTANDATYYAMKLGGNSSSYLYLAGNLITSGSTSTSGGTSFSYSSLNTYDYVYLCSYVSINNVQVRAYEYLASKGTAISTSKPSGGYAYYDGKTLTLSGYTGSNTGCTAISCKGALVIELSGSNSLTTSTTSGTAYRGIEVAGTLTIQGTGNLTVNGGQNAIYSSGKMVIKSTGTILCNGSTIRTDNNMEVYGANIQASGLKSYSTAHAALNASGIMKIEDSAINVSYSLTATISGTTSMSYGLMATKYINITDSDVTLNAGMGISSRDYVSFDGGTLTITGSYGVYAVNRFSVVSGTVDIVATYDAITCSQVVFNGGFTTAVSTNTAMDSTYRSLAVDDLYIAAGLNHAASTGTSFSYGVISADNLKNYDYIVVGDFISVKGVMLKPGQYLDQDATTPTSTSKSSNTVYYYGNGSLMISEWTYAGTSVPAITIQGDLSIIVWGTCELRTTTSNTITVGGDLTLTGSYDVDTLKLSCTDKYPLRVKGDLTVNIDPGDQCVLASTNNIGIFCDGTISIAGGSVTVNGSSSSNSTVWCGGDLKMSGGELQVQGEHGGLYIQGEANFSGGFCNVKATNGNGAYFAKNLTLSGNAVVFIKGALYGALVQGRLNMQDQCLVVKSTAAGTSDSTYYALRLNGTNSDYYNVASGLLQYASSDCYFTTGGPLNVNSLNNYDCIAIGDYVIVIGEVIPDGYSLNQSTKKLVKGDGGTDYAYYKDNVLTLNAFTYDGPNRGILCYHDLTVKPLGTSSLSTAGAEPLYINGDLTLFGTGTLNLKTSYYANVKGALLVKGGAMKITSTGNYPGIWSEDCTVQVSGGKLSFNATDSAMDVEKLVVTGGYLDVTSQNYGMYLNTLVLSGGTVTIHAQDIGIQLSGSQSDVSGGKANITSVNNTALYAYAATLNVTGGELIASGGCFGIDTKYYAQTGGSVTANGIDAAINTRQSHTLGDNIYGAGKYSSDGNLNILYAARWADYKYIYLTEQDFVIVGNVLVPSGYYLDQGASVAVSKSPASSNWVFYINKVLTMNNFTFHTPDDVISMGIQAPHDLMIAGFGENQLSTRAQRAIIVEGNLTLTGKLSAITTNNSTINVSGNIEILDGLIVVNSSENTAIVCDSLTISKGELDASGFKYAISTGSFTQTGGILTARSTDTESKDTYALHTSNSLTLGDGIHGIASTTPNGGNWMLWSADSNNTQKIVYFCSDDFVLVGGVYVPSGSFLPQGSTTAFSSKPDTSNYIYYYNGILLMIDYSYSGLSRGIQSPRNLNIQLGGTNSIETQNSYTVYVEGDLTIENTGSLILNSKKVTFRVTGHLTIKATVKATSENSNVIWADKLTLNNATVTAVNTPAERNYPAISAREMYVIDSGLTITSTKFTIAGDLEVLQVTNSSFAAVADTSIIYAPGAAITFTDCTTLLISKYSTGIHCTDGTLTVNGGSLNVTAQHQAVVVDKFIQNSGTALLISTEKNNDSQYYAIKANSISFPAGATVMASTDSAGTNLENYQSSANNSYDYIKVEKGGGATGSATVSGTVTSYLTTGTVTIKLIKDGNVAYTTTVTAASGSPTSYAISGVAAGTYTMEVSKANHVTQTYTVTVGSSNVTQDAKICPVGDITGDGKVNMKDWSQLYNHINEISTLSGYSLACADTNGDGKVNMKDWSILYNHISEIKPIW